MLVNGAGFGKEVALRLRLLTVPVLGRAMSRRVTPSGIRMIEHLNFANPDLATPMRIKHALAIAAQPGTVQVVWETGQGLASARRGIGSRWRESLLRKVAADEPSLVVWGDRDRAPRTTTSTRLDAACLVRPAICSRAWVTYLRPRRPTRSPTWCASSQAPSRPGLVANARPPSRVTGRRMLANKSPVARAPVTHDKGNAPWRAEYSEVLGKRRTLDWLGRVVRLPDRASDECHRARTLATTSHGVYTLQP